MCCLCDVQIAETAVMICSFQIFTSKDDTAEGSSTQGKKTNQAKELLARYGGAYLATSISLSIVSFTLCYVLVQSGVDVSSVLEKVRFFYNLLIYCLLLGVCQSLFISFFFRN